MKAYQKGFLLIRLHYAQELRNPQAYFEDITDGQVPKDQLQLAEQLLKNKTDAAKYSKDFLGAEVSFRLSIEALKKASGQRTGLLFGTLNYEDVDAETHRLRFLTRVFYRAPGGPGRINPSYKYTVAIEPEGPPETIHVPVAHDVPPGGQDHLLVGIFTHRPAAIEFNVRARFSDATYVDAGVVKLTTFYPKHYGLGGEPAYANKPYLLLDGTQRNPCP